MIDPRSRSQRVMSRRREGEKERERKYMHLRICICVMCQRGGPMNGRGMKGRKEDGPAVEESRCVRSIPIVYTYRTWRRRLSWVCPISRAQHPAFVSCVLSLFLSRTCLYRSLAFPCPWSIPSKGHRTSGFIKPLDG